MELKNHFSLSSTNDVVEICKPLHDIGITYFNYIKIYHNDSSRALLTNNAAWIDHFYRYDLYKCVGAIDIEYLLPKGYFLWSELDGSDPVYGQGRDAFNIDNGISFVIKRKTCTLLYIFASTRDNNYINNFYVRNVDLFQRFILYFNDKGSNLLKKSEKNKIYLPEKQLITPDRINSIRVDDQQKKQFYDKTKIRRFFLLNEESDVYLTKREAECSAYLIDGASAKQTAKAIGTSFRTIQGYIENIKEKYMGITGSPVMPTKSELISFLEKTGIHNVVFYDFYNKK